MSKIFKLLCIIGLFIYLSYIYFLKNSMCLFGICYTQLPFISQVVDGKIYWLIIAIICYLIWENGTWVNGKWVKGKWKKGKKWNYRIKKFEPITR